MLLVLLMITPAIVAEVMWCMIAGVLFRLTQTRFLMVASILSAAAVGALLAAVGTVRHAVASSGLLI